MTTTSRLLGVNVSAMSRGELLVRLEELALAGGGATITYYNIHAANLAYEQPWFREFLNSCDVVICDGFGVKVGALLVGQGNLHRRPPGLHRRSLLIDSTRGLRVYLLGAGPGVADSAARGIRSRFPSSRLECTMGTSTGTPTPTRTRQSLAQSDASRPMCFSWDSACRFRRSGSVKTSPRWA